MSGAEVPRFLVQFVDRTWYIGWPDKGEPIESRAWLEQWLGARGASLLDVEFGSSEAEQQFVEEFGPLT